VGLDEVEDAPREFNLKFQIVSRPPSLLTPELATEADGLLASCEGEVLPDKSGL
jgi:hypothetical protein